MNDDERDSDVYRLVSDGVGGLIAITAVAVVETDGLSDFEGLFHDGQRFLIAEEDSASIVFLSADGIAERRQVILQHLHTETTDPGGTENTGFEGITFDSDSGVLYLAIERQYRMIYEVDSETLRRTGFFDVPSGWRLPRWERAARGGWISIFPDYTGLFFEHGYLYALVRNDPAVLKIDPRQRRLVHRVEFSLNPTDYYETQEPFGLAEGLALVEDRMLVLLDNNGLARQGTPGDRRSMLLEFSRPPGF